MRLAAHLGMTYGEVSARMSSEEVSLWLAKERFDPIPDLWTMYGMLAALLANPYRGKHRAFAPEDFIPGRRRQRRQQSPEEMMRVLDRMAARIERNGRSG